MRRLRSERERGASLLESAIILPVILTIAIGMAEIGFAMVSQMTATNATREGARVGAAGKDNATAELAILRAVEQAMCAIDSGELVTVEIFKADPNGDPENASTLLNRYVPSGPLVCTSSGSTSLTCSNGCPWPPSARSTSVADLDEIGVRISYTHEWVSSFVFRDPAMWSDSTVMRLEPDTGA